MDLGIKHQGLITSQEEKTRHYMPPDGRIQPYEVFLLKKKSNLSVIKLLDLKKHTINRKHKGQQDILNYTTGMKSTIFR